MLDLIPSRRRFGQVSHELPDVFREMERMVKNVWQGFPFEEVASETGFDWAPRVDVSENEEAILVRAELPGLETKDIDISLDRDILEIRGEKKHEKEETDKRYHRVERVYGSFCRSLRLPAEVASDKIDAVFKNGVLTVTLPKTETAKKKIAHIKIH